MCSCACSHTKRRVSAHCWLTKTCLCVTFNIWHHVCHQISHRRSRNDVQPHELTYEPFSLCNFSRTKSCLRTLVWPTRRTFMRVHCEKTSLYATFWLTWTCPHAHFLIAGRLGIQHNFICLCSSDMYLRSVSTTRRVHARLHTLKDGCLHTFWLTKSCLCVSLNIWHILVT